MRLLRVRPRLRLFRFLCFSSFLCSVVPLQDPGDRASLHPVYREKIKDWQMRIQREGWSEKQVHSILLQFRSLATYRMEIGITGIRPGSS